MRTAVLTLIVALASAAHAQPFTYQGELRQDGVAANGSHDFIFTIYAFPAGGLPFGDDWPVSGLSVDEGKFTIEINPGPGVFTGGDRWLEIQVRPAGTGDYTTLFPRHRITATPYASRSLSEWLMPVSTDRLRNDPARTRLLINRDNPLTNAEYFGLTTPTGGTTFGGMYINTESSQGQPFYGYASGGSVRSWTSYDSLNSRWLINVGGVDRLAVASSGNVGIGTTSPTQRLDVAGITRSENFRYTTPRQRVISLPPSAFVPRTSTNPWVVESIGGFAYYEASVGTAIFYAPIILPQGAVVTEIVGYFRDNSSAFNMDLNIFSRQLTSSTYSLIATASTTGASTNIQTVSPQPLGIIIDNTSRVYMLSVYCFDWQGVDTGISGVRITYTVAEPD